MFIQEMIESAKVDVSWRPLLIEAFNQIDTSYLSYLATNQEWLPGYEKLLSAFLRPKNEVRYILLGESPYPRKASANGLAFWDAAVNDIWSNKGLSKPINRATSLRNIMKMLLHAEGVLHPPFRAEDIAALNKALYVQTLSDLFRQLLNKGFILLNASLVWSSDKPVTWHAKHWRPFMQVIFQEFQTQDIKFLLFGKIAQQFAMLPPDKCLVAEHPYVLSFIENNDVLDFFRPFHLLRV